jgi:hypothetical protein
MTVAADAERSVELLADQVRSARMVTFKNSRNILFKGLAAGTTYVMELMGLGGSTGQSDWSDSFTKVAV